VYTKADFGSVDVVSDDQGNAYIIDFNATPFTPRHDLSTEVAAFLWKGLKERAFALSGQPHY
jgi:predicted ATP-grasp superfamily ATP-dependent carboligase